MIRNREAIQHFLLVFDHAAGKLVELIEFGDDSERAVAAYAAREQAANQRPGTPSQIEIVLIGSDSLDTVKLTHANYFDGSAGISKYLDLVGRPS